MSGPARARGHSTRSYRYSDVWGGLNMLPLDPQPFETPNPHPHIVHATETAYTCMQERPRIRLELAATRRMLSFEYVATCGTVQRHLVCVR